MKKCFFSFIIITLIDFAASSQTFYYSDQNGDIHTYNIETCEDTLVIDVLPPNGSSLGVVFGDITFAPDGNLYGITTFGELYQINILTGELLFLTDFYPGIPNVGINSLTSDAEGNLYAAGSELYTYNIISGAASLLDDLPIGIYSAGDLTFSDGNLYLSGYSEIVLINIADPPNSSILFPYPITDKIIGISTFFITCDSFINFGSGEAGSLYTIDFTNIPASKWFAN